MEYKKKDKLKISLVLLLLCFLLAYTDVYAACTGSSPTWIVDADSTSVNSCISSASAGDTVYVDSGSFPWSPTLTKRISLIGGGQGPGQTPATTTILGQVSIIPVLGAETNQLRVSGFTINKGGTPNLGNEAVRWGATNTNYNLGGAVPTNARLDHNIILNENGNGIRFSDTLYGVIDNNTFGTPTEGMTYVIYVQNVYYTSVFGVSPQNVWNVGSASATYFEDNIIYVRDGWRFFSYNIGGKAVIRYNTITLLTDAQEIWELHGTQGSAYPSAFGLEYYGNVVLSFATYGHGIGNIRSGENIVFWNTTSGENTNLDFHFYYGITMECPATEPELQMIHSNYFFNNRDNYTGNVGVAQTGNVLTPTCGDFANRPTAGRDYINENQTSPGITSGTLGSRPAACTTRQGYWATDQATGITDLTSYVGDINTYPNRETISGTLYKCTATNTWTPYYTPFAYPHSLRGSSVTTTPRSPANVR